MVGLQLSLNWVKSLWLDAVRYASSADSNPWGYGPSSDWRDALVLGRPWRLNELILVDDESRCSLLWPAMRRQSVTIHGKL
jgi:hypothetical protein